MKNGYPESASEAFEEIAKWLDLADKAFVKLAHLQGEEFIPGDAIQNALRRLASSLDPNLDDMLMKRMGLPGKLAELV